MKNGTTPKPGPVYEETSYDTLWSWIAWSLIAFGCLVIVFLATGSRSIFPDENSLNQDDVKASAGLIGALGSSIGLAALGLILGSFVKSTESSRTFPWPRLEKVESKKRNALVAAIALALTIIVPVGSLTASLVVYVSKSEIADWDATTPLSDGFIGSRLTAIQTNCDSQPCFRISPKDSVPPFAFQWFVLSDVVLLVSVVFAVVAWSLWGYRSICVRNKTN